MKYIRYILLGLIVVSVTTVLAATATYTVQPGDTWESIALKNNVSVQQLADMNQPVSGQVLNIPASTPAPTPPPTSNVMCYNYGHQPLPYNWAQVDADMAHIKSTGCTSVRLADMGWNNPNTEALALRVISDGLIPIMGGDWGTFHLSDETNYTNQVLSQAAWQKANGINEIDLGNEQEYRLSGITKSQWVSFLRGLSNKVKSNYGLTVGYVTSGDFADFWATQSLGSIDKLGLNLYCGYGCNARYLQENITSHPGHVFIGETNCDLTGSNNCPDDATLSNEVQNDAVKLLNFNVPEYFFAYRSGGDGTSPVWGLYSVTAQYPLTVHTLGL